MGRGGDEERRRHPRSRRGFPIAEDKAGPGELTHVDNISCSGVLCHTKKPIPEMTKMSVSLELPDPVDKVVEAEGVVVRCIPDEQGDEHYRVAILYTEVSDDDLEAIREYVERDLNESDED